MKLVSTAELSDILKISPRWIQIQVKKEKNPLPCYRVGRCLRFYPPKVLDWIEAGYANDRQGKQVKAR